MSITLNVEWYSNYNLRLLGDSTSLLAAQLAHQQGARNIRIRSGVHPHKARGNGNYGPDPNGNHITYEYQEPDSGLWVSFYAYLDIDDAKVVTLRKANANTFPQNPEYFTDAKTSGALSTGKKYLGEEVCGPRTYSGGRSSNIQEPAAGHSTGFCSCLLSKDLVDGTDQALWKGCTKSHQ